MNKIKEYVWVIAIALLIGFGAVMAYFWWDASVVSAKLERQKIESEQIVARLAAEKQHLESDNAAQAEQNKQLMRLIQDLRLDLRELKEQVNTLRQETAQRLQQVRTLPLETIAVETAKELDLPTTAILVLPDSTLSFTPEASRVNLEHLILGGSAQQELKLSREQIANLERQLEKGRELVANKDTIIENKEKELLNVREEMASKLELKDAEIGALKVKMRKRSALSVIGGFLLAVVAKVVLL